MFVTIYINGKNKKRLFFVRKQKKNAVRALIKNLETIDFAWCTVILYGYKFHLGKFFTSEIEFLLFNGGGFIHFKGKTRIGFNKHGELTCFFWQYIQNFLCNAIFEQHFLRTQTKKRQLPTASCP